MQLILFQQTIQEVILRNEEHNYKCKSKGVLSWQMQPKMTN